MPVQEIRETIELPSIPINVGYVNIVQRKINLVDNVQHNMLQCDLFMDNLFLTEDVEPWAGVCEVLVTPKPVIYTDMTISGFPSRSPAACSSDQILFKAILNGDSRTFSNLSEGSQFPNQFLGTETNFAWYHPTLYITVLFHTTETVVLKDVALSFYMSVHHKKIPSITQSLGQHKENIEQNIAAVVSNSRMIWAASNVGQISPWWEWGGSRPEYMMKSDAFAEFFRSNATQEAEKTVDPTQLRIFAALARQMVANPDPLGTGGSVKGDIPDWISFMLPEGIESGPIRPQWPAVLHEKNGNVTMV